MNFNQKTSQFLIFLFLFSTITSSSGDNLSIVDNSDISKTNDLLSNQEEVYNKERVYLNAYNAGMVSDDNDTNPLYYNITQIFPGDEIAFCGGEQLYENSENPRDIVGVSQILDDNYTDEIFTDSSKIFGETPKMASGNIDDDLYDEMVIAAGSPYYPCVYDIDNTGYHLKYEFSSLIDGFDDVYLCNIDNDEYDEIFFYANSQFLVYDDALHDYALIQSSNSYTHYVGPTIEVNNHAITSGDVDGDGIDEIILVELKGNKYFDTLGWKYKSYWTIWVLDDDLTVFDEMDGEQCTITSYISNRIDVEAGDIDGDGDAEIIVFNGNGFSIYDDEAHDFQLKYETAGNYYSIDYHTFYYLDGPEMGKIKLGNFDEKEDYELAVAYPDGSKVIILIFDFSSSCVPWIKDVRLIQPTDYYTTVGCNLIAFELSTGNFDGDIYDELAYIGSFDHATAPGNLLHIQCYDMENFQFGSLLKQDCYTYENNEVITYPAIVMGDFDGDALTVEYKNEHNTTMSNPHIISVLAAPPTITGLDQNYQQSTTKYGTGITNSEANGNGYSTTHGFTFSLQTPDCIKLFKFVQIKTSHAFTWASAKTGMNKITYSESSTFSSDSSDDYIVFEATLYDHYYYEVIGGRNASEIGDIMTIDIPGESTIYKWTRTYFNENNGNSIDVGNETLMHTVGQVWTYPNNNDKVRISGEDNVHGFWDCNSAIGVGQGGGTNEQSIMLNQEETTTITRTFGYSTQNGFSICNVFEAAYTYSMEKSSIYETTVGENTAYQGVVGDIGATYYDDYKYSFGLFVYNLERTDEGAEGISYQVINYWIEGYNGPTANPTDNSNDNTNLISNTPVIFGLVLGIMVISSVSLQKKILRKIK